MSSLHSTNFLIQQKIIAKKAPIQFMKKKIEKQQTEKQDFQIRCFEYLISIYINIELIKKIHINFHINIELIKAWPFVVSIMSTYMRLKNSPISIMSTYSVMYIYSSFSLSILSPYSLVVFVTLTEVKAVLNCIVVVFVVLD